MELLATVDEAHETLSGPRVVKKVVRRAELLRGHYHGFRFQACFLAARERQKCHLPARDWQAAETQTRVGTIRGRPEVKSDSRYLRFVIAKHSPERVLETGLLM